VAAVSPARRAAYETLLRVFEQDAYADRAFRTAARDLDERERAFAQRLAYGSVQRVRTLDHAIDRLGKRPTRKLDPPVRAALRLGAYQLGYTDTAPHAAANESVELVRRARLERAVPFTNAVMRRLAAGIHDLLAALPEGALKESYPDWIHETFVRDLGPEGALELERAMNEPLETIVRGDAVGEPTDVPGAYRVDRVDEQLVAAGRIWPQSRGSQVAGLALGAREGERILDLCAAPGGKTGQLSGDVTAVEIDPGRASELRANLATMGHPATVVEADATDLPPELTGFDRILLDAPCSGLGVLAQRPDLRWRARPLPELQLALLRAAAERGRPGGRRIAAALAPAATSRPAPARKSLKGRRSPSCRSGPTRSPHRRPAPTSRRASGPGAAGSRPG
jgi:16S rRNA (cytosine967-C5)-methyltransferase